MVFPVYEHICPLFSFIYRLGMMIGTSYTRHQAELVISHSTPSAETETNWEIWQLKLAFLVEDLWVDVPLRDGLTVDIVMPWIGDSAGSCLLPLRSMAHLSGHFHPTHSRIPYFRRLRLLPVPSSSPLPLLPPPFCFIQSFLCFNSLVLAGVSLGLFLVQSVRMLFFLRNITAAIDPILAYRLVNLPYFKIWNNWILLVWKVV